MLVLPQVAIAKTLIGLVFSGLLALNGARLMLQTEEHVWVWSTYWGTWDEVLDIEPSATWGEVWVVREKGSTRIRSHATTQDADYLTTKEPPVKPMNNKEAREWCRDTKDQALKKLKDMGLTKHMLKKPKKR